MVNIPKKYYLLIERRLRIISCWLFVPGNNKRALEKVTEELNPNYIIIDLEDAIPQHEKVNTRIQVNNFLMKYEKNTPLYIRINDVNSEFFAEDLSVIHFEKVEGIILPKCEDLEDVWRVQDILEKLSIQKPIIPLIETVKGYYNLERILEAEAVSRIAFGSVDLAMDLSILEEDILNNPLVQHIRLQISLLSKKHKKLPPIDSPCIYLDSEELLENETVNARKLGYNGKLAIHPKQIKCIQQVFEIQENELFLAKEIVETFEANNYKTIAFKNMMVDMPVYLKMKNLLSASET